MNNAVTGVLVVAVVGGIAFAASRAGAASGGSDNPSVSVNVTGPSGTTYGLRRLSSHNTAQGVVETWEVSDSAGVVLEYQQFQGDDTSRILVLTPDAPHKPGDPMWIQAASDFAVFTSIPGLSQ